jgi:hypothetical protein
MPLVSMGCVMMRKCHLNTCAVGIATQDPVLRARFKGKPEHVVNFFFFIAEQMRKEMAKLGFRTVDQMVGRVDKIDTAVADVHWKAKGIDLSSILYSPALPSRVARRKMKAQDHGLEKALDHALIEKAKPALESQKPVTGSFAIRNVHRTVGAMLGGEIARRYGSAGLPDETIHFKFQGSAGQSFGAFVPNGVTMELEGDANDTLSLIRPRTPASSPRKPFWWVTSCSMARPPVKHFLTAWPANGLPYATPALPRWLRAWATTAANT